MVVAKLERAIFIASTEIDIGGGVDIAGHTAGCKSDVGIKAIHRWRDITNQAVCAVDAGCAMEARVACNWFQATKIPIAASVKSAG